MRTLFLFIIAIGFLTAGTYYQNDGQIPFLSNYETATTTNATTSPERIGVIDRILNFFHRDKSELAMDAAELEETKQADESNVTTSQNQTNTNNVTATDIKTTAENIQTELNELTEEVNDYTAKQNSSPYAEQITLQMGGAKSTNPEQEYVILKAQSNNSVAINISGWKLESSVTNQAATIPTGSQYLISAADKQAGDIKLAAGETAYIVSGDNPLRVSFRENDCSGYLKSEGSFTPTLGNYCPLPSDELLQFGGSNNDNAKCTDYVSKINRCEEISESAVADADISGSCERFIIDTLNYKGCAEKHSSESTYLEQGTWRIYLNRNGELWRSTKETIKLLDGAGRVVTTLEY